jgi:plastocyanin
MTVRKMSLRSIDRAAWLAACAGAALLAGCSGSKQPSPEAAAKKPVTYFKVDPQTAGALIGKVLFEGKKPARKKVDFEEDPLCAKLHTSPMYDDSIVVNPDGTLRNAFVYIKQGLEGKKFQPPSDPATIDQKGCWFTPRITGIQTGQTLAVTNSDPVTHNIHPRAHVNREWNQSQAPGSEPLARHFLQPEVMIRVKCNIHGWMHAWIGVVDSPYFGVTGPDGSFQLSNVPPGTYTVEAWHEVFGTQEQQVTVGPSGTSAINFTFKGESNP